MPNPCGTTLPEVPTSVNIYPTFGNFGLNYLYCNNPEQLLSTDYLGDRNLGGRYLLWAYVGGPCQTWYEHLNLTGATIGYGVKVRNPHRRPVTVSVTRVGFGVNDPVGPWKQFFTGASGGGGTVGGFVLPGGDSLWIQRNDAAIPHGAVFNGAVRFSVSGGKAYVFWYAYRDVRKVGGKAKYLGWVRTVDPNGENEARVYKGLLLERGTGRRGTFLLTAGLSYTVSQILAAPPTWASHWCFDGSNDMMDIRIPTGGPRCPRAATVSCDDPVPANLGNWGVQYRYTLRLVNDTLGPRTVHLLVSQFGNAVSNVIVATPAGVDGCAIGAGPGSRGRTWDFHDVTLAPGETTTVEWEVILGASSGGHLTNSIVAR